MYRSPAWATAVAARVQRDQAELVAEAVGPAKAASAATLLTEASAAVLLREAEKATELQGGLRQWWRGSRHQLALMRMHEAEALIALGLDGEELAAHARDLLVLADELLPRNDPRVTAVSSTLIACPQQSPTAVAVAHLAWAVCDAQDERYAQSCGFRNRLIRLIGLAVLGLVVLLTAFAVNAIPLGIEGTAGASSLQAGLLVGLFGAIGATIVGVPPLARVGGTWNPFPLPWYQMLLKVALGPLFAIVGVLLLQAHLIPNVAFPMPLSDLLVWALAFGAAQHAVTRAVDSRVSGLVDPAPPSNTAPAAGRKPDPQS